MPSDYDSIRADNIREYGEGTRHLSFLGRLYTDRTHFIFELLQNAEDAGASKILFELFEDRLEVKHDGRSFNELDVRGVCGVGEGTKAEDLTQIGTFGIGFKSVYAYTSAPEVHSGEEHFRIEHYVRSYKAATKVPGDSWTTLFVFAFDAPGLEPQTAMHEIAERLRNLTARTLLFLRKIEEIEYKLLDNQGGFYLRGKPIPRDKAMRVNVIGQNNGQNEDENWLVFDRPLSVPDPNKPDHVKTVWVEIGFKLETNTKDQTESIVRIKESPLIVYFPTEKLTRFGFLIQGPYRTTPSRDNIPKDDDWNAKLVEEIALLLVDALQRLKEMGLLTVALLNVLPIRMDDFPEDGMFYPIVKAVRNALMDQKLLPANEGTFVSARNAKLARGAELRKLLTYDQLRELFQSKDDIRWLSGEITKNKTVDLYGYLKRELKIDEVRPKSEWGATGFAEMITPSFIEKQSDEWMIVFYEFLYGQESLWENEYSPLRNKPFIRLQDGTRTHVPPFKKDGSPNAYLPPENDTEFPVVKQEIAKDEKALEFLKKLGLTEPGAVAEVIRIIPKYTHDNPQISDDEHMRDMKKILHAYSTEDSKEKKSLLASRLRDTAFIRAENQVLQKMEYKKPSELYLQNDDLLLYFYGNKDVWFVSSEYDACFYDLFKDIGTYDVVCVKRKMPGGNRHVVIANFHGWHERGLNGFDPHIEIDGLEYAIKHPSIEKSLFIWNSIAIDNADCICGIVESSSKKTFENSKKNKQISQKFGQLLMQNDWLPGKQGKFHKPSKLEPDGLPDSFVRDEKLVGLLEMKKNIVSTLAEKAGVSVDDINLIKQLKEYPDVYEKLKADILSKKKKAEFPEKALSNAERRKEKIIEKYRMSPKKKYEKKGLSKKTTENTIDPRTWLREIYTNKEGQMICQICQKEMPFKKRNGKYYFEAIELLNDFDREMEELHIALCPLCAAMYNEFVKHGEGTIESLKNALMNSEDTELPLQLGDLNTSVRFVERHFLDIRTIIEAQE